MAKQPCVACACIAPENQTRMPYLTICFTPQMAEKNWHKGPAREAGLVATLRQLHQLITLTHSPIQNLLTQVCLPLPSAHVKNSCLPSGKPLSGAHLGQDSSGRAARRAIEEVLCAFGDRLARRRRPEYPALHNPLAACEAAPLLQLPQPLFLSASIRCPSAISMPWMRRPTCTKNSTSHRDKSSQMIDCTLYVEAVIVDHLTSPPAVVGCRFV